MHFYELLNDGGIEPRHYVPMVSKPDESRPTRVSDVRKMIAEGRKVVPSVTTIQRVLDKPALVNWQIDRHLEAAWYNNALMSDPDLPMEYYIKEVKRLASEEMEKAPQAGTDFHALMEAFINKELAIEHESFDLCREVCNLIFDKTGVPMDEWQSEINVFSTLGYSGQCDLFIPGSPAYVIDFKTKQFADKFNQGKMGFWKSHLSQLMAYGAELDPSFLFTPVKIFVCLETGEIDWHQWDNEKQKTKAFNYFLAALNVFNVDNEL